MKKEEWTVQRLLKLSGGFWETCTLHAGVKLGIFTLISDEYLSDEEIAGRMTGDVRGVTTLLNALTAMGLLVKENGRYGNTAASKSFLVKGARGYVGYMIMHHSHLVPAWAELSQAVKNGQPVRKRTLGEKERESFLMGMFNLAMGIAPNLAKEIDLKDRRHLLDIGGGPGTYVIHFCLENPDLRGTVYDLPTTRPFALKTIERFELTERVGFQSGDYTKNTIEGTYDVAWLSHILHGEGPEQCKGMIKKAVRVLEPGGLILVHDFIMNQALDSPLFPALFSLNMLVNTKGGRSYSETQIKEMLTNAGVKDIRRLPFRGPNDSGIICGIV